MFASPERADVVNVTNSNTQMSNVKTFFDTIASSSYVVFDSGYKYMYDRYNDQFRYVPLNGDIAGLCARTDITNDSCFHLLDLNRGIIRSRAVKLAFNPNKHKEMFYILQELIQLLLFLDKELCCLEIKLV